MIILFMFLLSCDQVTVVSRYIGKLQLEHRVEQIRRETHEKMNQVALKYAAEMAKPSNAQICCDLANQHAAMCLKVATEKDPVKKQEYKTEQKRLYTEFRKASGLPADD